ncbi:MAG: thioredoxin domain-containing protein [Flavobacteriaceae bacterium]|nr:thioredoxin domain-containing protein [Flavobacteriaceae bacterium]
MFFLLNQFSIKNNIQLDKEEVKIQLLSHPYYPSINSITDLFNHFNIDNLALKVDNNLEAYSQIPDTFLAQIKEDKGSQLVVVSKKMDGVELIYDEHKSKKISVNKFFELWTGILVVIEKQEKKDSDNLNKAGKIKKLVYFSTFVMLSSFFILANPSLFQIIYFALTCVGVYISYLIVIHELGLHSKILDKFCSGGNKNTNCDAVLSSKGATILGLFKLSDVGFVYFTALVLVSLIITLSNLQTTSVIFMMSTLAIPFTFYSIYYQWKVVKNWCPLCLSIVSILWLQFGALFLNDAFWKYMFIIDLSYVFFIASLLTTTSLWILIQPLLKKEQLFEKLEIEHIKFKRNFKLFKAALNLNPILDTSIPAANELIFGNKNPDALLNIIVITNPMCGYCKESHRVIEKILKNENSNIQIIIRFNVQPNDEGAKGTKIATKILELYHTTNEKNCLYALSDIYGEMDANTWLKKWGETINKTYLTTLKYEKEWCNNNKINFTPALFLNGQQYPKEYGKMDLLYFIDELIEERGILENAQPNFVESL